MTFPHQTVNFPSQMKAMIITIFYDGFFFCSMANQYDDQGFFQTGSYDQQQQGTYDMGGVAASSDFPQDP